MNNHNVTIPLYPLGLVEQDPPEYAGWRDYPLGCRNSNPLTTPVRAYSDQLRELRTTLFDDEVKIKLRIIDISVENGTGKVFFNRLLAFWG